MALTNHCPFPSVIHPLARISQLLPSPFRVPGRRVQVLVAEDLSQADQIVAIVVQVLVAGLTNGE
jgi:hypothetical protein